MQPDSSTQVTISFDGTASQASQPSNSRRTLSTFSGVFCPIALAQFSSLLFLRLGFMVGQAGILLALLQLVLAYALIGLTILSICAISTNGAIEGGGVYFMISRTLGPEFGGSIGILFYMANVFSSALYIAAFVEPFIDNFGHGGQIASVFPDTDAYRYLYKTVICFVCLLICLIGSRMFARTNMIILMGVLICFVTVVASFFRESISVPIPKANKLAHGSNKTHGNFTGLSLETLHNNLFPHWSPDYTASNDDPMTFQLVFAIAFSGVTGIMNGANMSGDLKNPAKSIPWGTAIATISTFTCYLIAALLTAATCDRFLLLNNFVYMQGINFWAGFVIIGVFATTLSASLGNLIGASRILEALAKDEIFGRVFRFATCTTSGGNPVVAVGFSFILVQVVFAFGGLNKIAPAVSIFFLLAYTCINLACAVLDVAASPNFRPTFRLFSWQLSCLGVIGCLVMSVFINSWETVIALVAFFFIVGILHLVDLGHATWGSISQALLFHQVRKYLLLLDPRKEHIKYWRLQILLLVASPRSAASLVKFVNDLKKGGLYVIGHVMRGNLDEAEQDPCIQSQAPWLGYVDRLQVKAFVEVTMSESVRKGMHHLVRISGMGAMKPNTVCLGFYDNSEPQDILARFRRRRRFALNLFSRGTTRARTGKGSGATAPSYQAIDPESDRPAAAHWDDGGGLSEGQPLLNPTHSVLSQSVADGPFGDDGESPVLREQETVHDPDDTDKLPPLRMAEEAEMESSARINAEEYVAMMADVLKMQKNLVICRHFETLDRDRLNRRWPHSWSVASAAKTGPSTTLRYIDVWPINFFQPGLPSCLDTACLFLLQLACVLSMAPAWRSRKLILRVFLCADVNKVAPKLMQQQLTALLEQLRIRAETKIVGWDDIVVDLEMQGEQHQGIAWTGATDIPNPFNTHGSPLPADYFTQVNQLIRGRSQETAVTFLYLPVPPNRGSQWSNYLDQLTLFTNELPPTVLAHGLHAVTSVNL